MSDRRVVFWVQEGNIGLNDVGVFVNGQDKGRTNGAGFIEFFIEANAHHVGVELRKSGVSEFYDGFCVCSDMTMTFNRRKTTPPAAPMSAIRRDGLVFRRADTNAIWKWRGITAFRAHEHVCAGNLGQVDDYFGWAAHDVGCNIARVFGMWVVTGFDPRRVPHYYDSIVKTHELARKHGMHLHWTMFTDQIDGSHIRMTSSEQQDHARRTLDALRACGYSLPECNNEDWKNGKIAATFHPSMFAGLLGTRSAPPDGEDPRDFGSLLEWTTDYTPRGSEWSRKFKMLIETARTGTDVAEPCQRPAVSGEPSRIGEGTTAREWADYAAGCDLFGAGMTIHGSRPSNGSSGLQDCVIEMHSDARDCINAVIAMWKDHPIPIDAASVGSYTRAGLADAPCEDVDAIRSYGMVQGHKLTMVRVSETSAAKMLNGWRVIEKRGPDQQVYLCER